MSISVNLLEAKEMIIRCIKAGLVPYMKGSPGLGKSSIVKQIAEEFNLKLIDIRLSQCDPTDLLGFPDIDRESNKARYVPMNTFPLENDKVPDGYSGWLVFMDELGLASPAVQKAAYKPLLDKEIGIHKLHRKVAMVAAGNLETDNALVEEMSTALQSRLIHLEVDIDVIAWLEWARTSGIDHRITSYIQFKPEELFRFNPDHDDHTFACSRTWEFASRLIRDRKELEPIDRNLLAGTLSEGVAREFSLFCEIYKDLPTIQEITLNPMNIPVPTEPSIQFAITGAIGAHVNPGNIAKLMQYVNRLPKEFQVVTLREITRRHDDLKTHDAVNGWVTQNAHDLF